MHAICLCHANHNCIAFKQQVLYIFLTTGCILIQLYWVELHSHNYANIIFENDRYVYLGIRHSTGILKLEFTTCSFIKNQNILVEQSKIFLEH